MKKRIKYLVCGGESDHRDKDFFIRSEAEQYRDKMGSDFTIYKCEEADLTEIVDRYTDSLLESVSEAIEEECWGNPGDDIFDMNEQDFLELNKMIANFLKRKLTKEDSLFQ